jgi:hypothetical protein
MVSEKQRKESAPPVISSENGLENKTYFLAEVCYFSLNLELERGCFFKELQGEILLLSIIIN